MQIKINGKIINISTGRNIQINNDSIIIDGKTVSSFESNTVKVTIEGNVENLECSGSVSVSGNVLGDINCDGSATVSGDVSGSIDCGGSCRCGNVNGNIEAGGSITLRK